jgi:hypothetical protein
MNVCNVKGVDFIFLMPSDIVHEQLEGILGMKIG